MNGTTLRTAAVVACVAALAAPGAALAKKRHAHPAKTAKPAATQIIVNVPHTYDAGGNGIELVPTPAGAPVNLFDPVELATSLGNQALGTLGLPPVQLPTL